MIEFIDDENPLRCEGQKLLFDIDFQAYAFVFSEKSEEGVKKILKRVQHEKYFESPGVDVEEIRHPEIKGLYGLTPFGKDRQVIGEGLARVVINQIWTGRFYREVEERIRKNRESYCLHSFRINQTQFFSKSPIPFIFNPPFVIYRPKNSREL